MSCVILCLMFIMSRVCRVQCLSVQGFIVYRVCLSGVCHVQYLSVQGLSCLVFVHLWSVMLLFNILGCGKSASRFASKICRSQKIQLCGGEAKIVGVTHKYVHIKNALGICALSVNDVPPNTFVNPHMMTVIF